MATELTTRQGGRADARPITTAASAPVVAIWAITALAAALRLASFAKVPGNFFYDAAVRSMGQSWHNFFYGAFEPGGQVSVDKTPVDLWLQVASTKLLGFSSVAVRLPEVVAGVLAVPLLYDLVRRFFGRTAGLGAAAALAVLPISILTARSDTMDSLMMLLDVLAAWLVVVGAQRRRAWPVLAAGAVLGVAFNVKVFEGLIVLPALVALGWLASDAPARRRALTLGGALLAFAAVSLSWVTAASLAPFGARPWPIGSTDGSVWNVVFWFNGLGRLRSHASAAALRLDPPGPLRFFGTGGHDYAALVGSLLLAALVFGALALGVAALSGGSRVRSRLPLAGATFLGSWLVIGVVVLSEMQRLQPRYLEAVTPAIAAAVGVAVAWLAAQARRRRPAAVALAGGAIVVATGGLALVQAPAWAAAAALGGAGAAAVFGLARPGRSTVPAACALVAALAVPAGSALSVARSHTSDAGLGFHVPGLQALSRFLISHQGRARYEVASSTVLRAGPLIVHDGRPVLMLTSYNGRPLLTPVQLSRLVAAGDVRYFLLGRGNCTRARCAPVIRWARAHTRDISAGAGVGRPGTLFELTN